MPRFLAAMALALVAALVFHPVLAQVAPAGPPPVVIHLRPETVS
ncbi:hypothetical protein [Enterovirga rhinocerotis]|uniref:Uncharacterized protein n=1 Tax=Enterovirga rhinocerotis TaxID=1339210 RepID=A0A4R7CAD9_9HYPH|nr:hypothetical protein [Enterovirga rhinocerotis]TDR95314.1 hypothetical protein EV668_0104 [Enterovirga rhinocerotis]